MFTDQIGINHILEKTPTRIISLVPSQTELLYDLGLEESIVGITKFCVHPFHLKSTKTIVGGTKKANYEKIKKLNPDIIIANKEENTLEMVTELRKICPVWVTNIITIEDNLKMIDDFGQLFNKRVEAQKWMDKTNFALQDFIHFIKEKSIQKVAYFIWREPYMVVGSDTFVDYMLTLNKFQNIYANQGRYPEIELSKMRLEGEPDLVFLSSEPYPFKEEHAFEIGRFTHHAKTVFVDGEMFSWYGSRLVKAFDYFKLLHNKLN
ncbi:helical backbone metal receptor [Flavobacterium sp.]|uniref:ABC transporter substrate-binding protein n=1 Tax=Flavobacterium sp. TaxID=239 RepID=UPI00286D9B4D|nr:helical backbone metal receptor [Flavobacterium sp.]